MRKSGISSNGPTILDKTKLNQIWAIPEISPGHQGHDNPERHFPCLQKMQWGVNVTDDLNPTLLPSLFFRNILSHRSLSSRNILLVLRLLLAAVNAWQAWGCACAVWFQLSEKWDLPLTAYCFVAPISDWATTMLWSATDNRYTIIRLAAEQE